jgi:hypothetical protein
MGCMDVSPKSLDSATAGSVSASGGFSLRPNAVARMVFDFYRHPASWLALAFTLIVMIYVGGAAMFWFHSI